MAKKETKKPEQPAAPPEQPNKPMGVPCTITIKYIRTPDGMALYDGFVASERTMHPDLGAAMCNTVAEILKLNAAVMNDHARIQHARKEALLKQMEGRVAPPMPGGGS